MGKLLLLFSSLLFTKMKYRCTELVYNVIHSSQNSVKLTSDASVERRVYIDAAW